MMREGSGISRRRYQQTNRQRRWRRKQQRRKNILLLVSVFGLALLFLALLVLISKAASSVPFISALSTDYLSAAGENSQDSNAAQEKILQVRTLCQNPELPTGCEATAAVMALDYLGEHVCLEDFARQIPCEKVQVIDGVRQGPDPEKLFAGSPFESSQSFGCFEQVIIDVINNCYPNCFAQKAEGSLFDLCGYIDENCPVLVWVTMEMQEVDYQYSWHLPDGRGFTWPGREHCMLLVGYDSDCFYFNDPRAGKCVPYEKELSEQRFEEMGSRAVVIR